MLSNPLVFLRRGVSRVVRKFASLVSMRKTTKDIPTDLRKRGVLRGISSSIPYVVLTMGVSAPRNGPGALVYR